MAKSALLTATAAALALVWCAQPAGATLAPPVVLEGVADTLMEDRFDTGEHFMHTVLTTAGGDRYLVDGVSHGEVYMSQPVRWVIQPAAAGTLGSVDAPTSLRSTFLTGTLVQALTLTMPGPGVSASTTDTTTNTTTNATATAGQAQPRRALRGGDAASHSIPQAANTTPSTDPGAARVDASAPRRLAASADLHGPNRILVTLVGFRDPQGAAVLPSYYGPGCTGSCAVNAVKTYMWQDTSSVAAVFADSSDGFTFVGPYAAAGPSTVLSVQTAFSTSTAACTFDAWADSAIAGAAAQGVRAEDYAFRLFIIPAEAGNGTCAWSGLAYVGCTPSNCRS